MPKAPSGKSRRRPEQPKLVTNSIKYKTEGPGAKSSRTSPSFPPSKISIVPAEKELDLDTLFATVKKGSKDTKQSSSEVRSWETQVQQHNVFLWSSFLCRAKLQDMKATGFVVILACASSLLCDQPVTEFVCPYQSMKMSENLVQCEEFFCSQSQGQRSGVTR